MSYRPVAVAAVQTALSTTLDAVAGMIEAVLGPDGLGLVGQSVPVATAGVDVAPGVGAFVTQGVRSLTVRYTECWAHVDAVLVSAYYVAPIQAEAAEQIRRVLDLYIPVIQAHLANRDLDGLAAVRDCLVESEEGLTLTWGTGDTARTYWGFKAISTLSLRVPIPAQE